MLVLDHAENEQTHTESLLVIETKVIFYFVPSFDNSKSPNGRETEKLQNLHPLKPTLYNHQKRKKNPTQKL